MIRLLVVHHAFWSIGSIAHTFGNRHYPTRDYSGNSFWLAIPNFGEGWHNNHHAFPTSAYFGLEWWQVDIGAYVIRALHMLDGITQVRHPSAEQKVLKLNLKNNDKLKATGEI
jgi:stearoyl-CoA desaturase (delta-9 desaturase)